MQMAFNSAIQTSFLALGDSYTIGEAVRAEERWPVQLAARLRAAGHSIAEPRILATTGWTTDELSAAIDATEWQAPYSMVSLSIGVNNQYRGRDLANYEAEFSNLLDRAIDFAGDAASRVLVVSIPDWGVTRFASEKQADVAQIACEIDAFNATKRAVTMARGSRWIDITAASRGEGRVMLADDGLHPSGEQYALWVARILPEAEKALVGEI